MSEKPNLSISRILQSIAPQLVVSFLVGCLGVVVSVAVFSTKLDNVVKRVDAMEITEDRFLTKDVFTEFTKTNNVAHEDIVHRLDIISTRLDRLILK